MVEILERVSVGGQEILPAEIAVEAQNHPSETPEAAWTAAAEALVIRRLMLDEAVRLGIVAADMLDADGQTLAPEDALIEALLEQEVTTPKADIATAERYYKLHKDRFTSPKIVEAEHILFAASPGDDLAYGLATGDARTTIRKLRADPSQFADLARQYSACPSKETGGNLGQIGPGQTVAPFEEALFGLSAGELCNEPVKTRFGVHVIRAGRCIEEKQLPFELVREKIATYLEEASWRRAVSQYLAILAAQAKVEGVALATADGLLVQ
ncbi:peptidylprolyl isomerase [Aquisediminimonas profunda]|uniref:peptidylprolyl isomerase n=1 Tax=Aquisediminimonas profunda TaxID=1550733 RepID=UPI001C63A4E6|nr:peptidylprolyl isomerase [Aquisediminimonas profunda]